MAKIGAWIAEVEEAGLGADQFIPESNRVRLCDASFDLKKNEAWAQYGQQLTGTNEFTNLKEITFVW
jgi:hypothetical protein